MFTEKVKMRLYTSPGILRAPYRLLLRYLDGVNTTISMSPDFFLETLFSLNPLVSMFSAIGKVPTLALGRCSRNVLSDLGSGQRFFALHSFRFGGASSIATNLKNCPSRERLLKLHGRSRSDLAKDIYVKEQVVERLDVAQSTRL